MKQTRASKVWRKDRIAEGWCAHCFIERAGANGGTFRLCGKCATKSRRREANRYYGIPNEGKMGRKRSKWARLARSVGA